jgi:hypothetical protein
MKEKNKATNKLQIDFADAIPLTGKISINQKDSEGNDLFIGDTIVDESQEKHVIGYRYGTIDLIPMFGIHTMCVSNYSEYTKTNEMTVIAGKYLIIGCDNEEFFEKNKEVLKSIEITNTIPQ